MSIKTVSAEGTSSIFCVVSVLNSVSILHRTKRKSIRTCRACFSSWFCIVLPFFASIRHQETLQKICEHTQMKEFAHYLDSDLVNWRWNIPEEGITNKLSHRQVGQAFIIIEGLVESREVERQARIHDKQNPCSHPAEKLQWDNWTEKSTDISFPVRLQKRNRFFIKASSLMSSSSIFLHLLWAPNLTTKDLGFTHVKNWLRIEAKEHEIILIRPNLRPLSITTSKHIYVSQSTNTQRER